MSAIRPNEAQFLELMQSTDEGPVVMVNLLKFTTSDGTQGEYEKYGDAVIGMVEKTGGKLLWVGKANQTLIGPVEESWDAVALVQYPSRKAFIEMVSQPGYNEIHEHREQGLERTIVIACTPRDGAI